MKHGHFLVNQRKVDIPSYQVKPGSEVSVREKSRSLKIITDSLGATKGREMATWLQIDRDALSGRLVEVPSRDMIPVPIQEQLIVGVYSK